MEGKHLETYHHCLDVKKIGDGCHVVVVVPCRTPSLTNTEKMAAQLWGKGKRPAAWATDPIFQRLEDLWTQIDRACNHRVLDEICIAADNLEVNGIGHEILRKYRRNLYSKIERKTKEQQLPSGNGVNTKNECACCHDTKKMHDEHMEIIHSA